MLYPVYFSSFTRVVRCLEKLNVKGMMKNGNLAALIARQGLYEFRQRLTKIFASGSSVVLADQWFPSSQTCQNCGHIPIRIKVKRPYFQPSRSWNNYRPRLKCGNFVIPIWVHQYEN